MRIRSTSVLAASFALALPLAAITTREPGSGATPPSVTASAPATSTIATVFLKNGNRVTGELLKERSDSLLVDLGFRAVEIPLADVLRIDRSTDATPDTTGNGFQESAAPLRERSVKDLSEELSQAVGMVTTPSGLGSCFAVDRKGHFVTNFHVIQGERELSITLFRKGQDELDRVKLEKVRIVAVNPYADLALLYADLGEKVLIAPPPIGASGALKDGQPVFAIGNPLGLERTVSEGIVSNTHRNFEGQLFIQTTAPINPGNSGGPLFNLRGEVVGVTNMKAGFFTEGLSFAIPVETVRFFLRNRDAFAFDKDNPNSGFHYLPPPRKASGTAEKP